jgi:hypothetical protein
VLTINFGIWRKFKAHRYQYQTELLVIKSLQSWKLPGRSEDLCEQQTLRFLQQPFSNKLPSAFL